MEQNKEMVTVTVTENGKEIVSLTDNKVLVFSGDAAFTSVSCKLEELLKFAVSIQTYFIKHLIPQLMAGTKSGVTDDMLFDEIIKIAKDKRVLF